MYPILDNIISRPCKGNNSARHSATATSTVHVKSSISDILVFYISMVYKHIIIYISLY